MMELSIIIPFSSKEEKLSTLLNEIPIEKNFEIILVGESDTPIPKDFKKNFVKSPLGRAIQMNKGASVAQGRFLWFLHADSRINSNDFKLFYQTQIRNPEDLTYFNLRFFPRSKRLVLNEIGAKIRSDLFKLPFGDQGLGVSKESFEKLGGFPLVSLGEDMLFVLMARKKGLILRNNGAYIYTSSRKYERKGWIKTTLIHLFYTIKLFYSFRLGTKTI